MRISQILRRSAIAGTVLTAAIGFSGPALAHDGEHADVPPPPPVHSTPRMDPAARNNWLADCREKLSRRDNGLGGALLGGLVGGAAGYGIAGKRHRTVGTVAGAAVGAAAGMAIDKAEDRGSRDECEAYLADYEARYSHGYAGYGYGGYAQGYPAYGYGGGCCAPMTPMMMVPVIRMARA